MGNDYIARCQKCNHIVCWSSEWLAANDPKGLANDLSQWVRWGLSVERMETEAARSAIDFGHATTCPDYEGDQPKSENALLKFAELRSGDRDWESPACEGLVG